MCLHRTIIYRTSPWLWPLLALLLSCIAQARTSPEVVPASQTPRPSLSYNVSGSNSWYPYYIVNQPQAPGVLSELLPQLLDLAGIDGRTRALPPNRTNQELDSGDLDFDIVSPSWFPRQDFGPNFVKSIPIMQVTEYLVTVPEKASQWQDIGKIKGQSIGTVRGYLYHNDQEFTRIDFPSELYLIKALHKGRIEAAIIDARTAYHWAEVLNLPISLAAVHSSGPLVFRLRTEKQALLPAINQAISTLIQNGTVQQLLDKYAQDIED